MSPQRLPPSGSAKQTTTPAGPMGISFKVGQKTSTDTQSGVGGAATTQMDTWVAKPVLTEGAEAGVAIREAALKVKHALNEKRSTIIKPDGRIDSDYRSVVLSTKSAGITVGTMQAAFGTVAYSKAGKTANAAATIRADGVYAVYDGGLAKIEYAVDTKGNIRPSVATWTAPAPSRN